MDWDEVVLGEYLMLRYGISILEDLLHDAQRAIDVVAVPALNRISETSVKNVPTSSTKSFLSAAIAALSVSLLKCVDEFS